MYRMFLQIQDYYVVMKLNDRLKSVMALYRLFIVSYMLKNARIEGMSAPHDYPKMMLCHMLAMDHWCQYSLPGWRMMEKNICVFNEEMGETYYSILSRCVLGDNIKSDFDHMTKLFKLLPIYKQVKDDVYADVDNSKFSLNWHHKVSIQDAETTATSFFFKRLIKSIVDGTYRSYSYTTKYPTIGACIDTSTKTYVPLVYKTDVLEDVNGMIVKIRKAISSNFMMPHMNDWPFRAEEKSEQKVENSERDEMDYGNGDGDVGMFSGEDYKHVDPVDEVWGPPWVECSVGRFAAIRCNIGNPPTIGLCIVKVTMKDAEITSGQWPIRTLEGQEYICTISNVHSRCVRGGKWNYHRNKSTVDQYDNSSVIVYFDNLHDGALPSSVVQAVESAHSEEPVFRLS